MLAHTDCVGQSRHLFSTEATPPGTYGPTMRCSHAPTTPTETGSTSIFSLLLSFCCGPIIQSGQMRGLDWRGLHVLCNMDNGQWSSPWSRGAMFKWRMLMTAICQLRLCHHLRYSPVRIICVAAHTSPQPNGTADVTYQAGLTGAWGRPG